MHYEFTLVQLLIMFSLVSLIGIIIGYMVVQFRGSSKDQARRIRQLEAEIEELQAYKEEVADHFKKTAGLLHDMTSQYKSIYEHMAEGARRLCDEEESGAVLESLQTGLLGQDDRDRIEDTRKEKDSETHDKSV